MKSHARKRGRRSRICGLAAALTAALATPAVAAPAWVHETELTGVQEHPCFEDPLQPGIYHCNSSVLAPHVALGADGDAAAVWTAGTGVKSAMTLFRPSGGAFSSSDQLAADVFGTRVDVDAEGRATAAWTLSSGAVEAATADAPGGEFGPSETVATAAQLMDLDVAPNGAALATLLKGSAVWVAYRPSGGDFGDAVPVSQTSIDLDDISAALDANGDAVIGWIRADGSIFRPEVVRRPASGALGAVRSVSDVTTRDIDVGINASGDAAVGWVEHGDLRPRARNWPAGGDLGSATSALAGATVFAVDIALDDTGNTLIAWSRFDGAASATEWRLRPSGGTYAGAVEITAAQGGNPDVEFWPSGDALAVWTRSESSGSTIASAVRPAGGTFGGALPVFSSPEFVVHLSLDVDSSGNAAVAWVEAEIGGQPTTHDQAFLEGFDGAPPALSNITVPASARPGQTRPFSANASDVWSSTGPVQWDFGDGSDATGGAVEHAYSDVGEYTVEISATDGLGQTATATRTITVSNDAQPEPGPIDGSDPGGPEVADFGVTNRVFRVGRRSTPVNVARRVRRGTKFVFDSSEAGRAIITIQQAKKGRRVRGKCRRATRERRDRPRCTRWLTRRPRLKRPVVEGKNRIKFTGRYGNRVLKPGRYRAKLRVKDADGNRSAVKRARFRVVR